MFASTVEASSLASLNPILARWLDAPVAPRVDCATCARPNKCCDFQPFIPNFLVGAMIASGHVIPHGDLKFIRQPIGLIPSSRFRAAHAAGAAGLACGFLRRGTCSIYAFRPGECGAYNCRIETMAFATETFDFEVRLSQMALIELGFSAKFVGRQIDILNDPGDEMDHAPETDEIFKRSWAWARDLSRADIDHWLEDT